MEKITNWNVRVYGLWIKNQQLLILREPYAVEILYKFPGGGVEFGEGVEDALKREFLEELNVKLYDIEHFYTQEHFVQSKFKKHEQLLTIYYVVKSDHSLSMDIVDPEKEIQEINWVPLENLRSENVTLPVDKIVVSKLLQRFG